MAAAALIATLATSVASIATAGKGKDKPDAPPDESSPEAQASRRRLIQARSAQTNQRSTILAGNSAPSPEAQRPTLLGGA